MLVFTFTLYINQFFKHTIIVLWRSKYKSYYSTNVNILEQIQYIV